MKRKKREKNKERLPLSLSQWCAHVVFQGPPLRKLIGLETSRYLIPKEALVIFQGLLPDRAPEGVCFKTCVELT